MSDTIHFYAVCLKSFRAGINHGRWIDARLAVEDITAEIKAMLASSSYHEAREWRIHSYETPSAFTFLSDETDIETLHEMALFIEEHGDRGVGLLEYMRGDVEEARAVLNRYFGSFPDGKTFAAVLCRFSYHLPKVVQDCIDFERLWQALNKTTYFAIPTQERGIAVFKK